MRTVTSLVAALLLVVSMSAVSYADGSSSCGGSTTVPSEPCRGPIHLADRMYFDSTGVTDGFGSPLPVGTLNYAVEGKAEGYGGDNANILSATGDYVNWIHKFSFLPPVDSNGIFKASLSLSLVDFKSGHVSSGHHRSEDDDHEHDSEGKNKEDNEGRLVMREHERNSDGHEREDIYTVNLDCLHDGSTSTTASAAVLLDGTTKWANIKSIHDDTDKFRVSFDQLYDGSFAVQLKSTLNSFEIEWAELSIDYCPAPVPEPGTMMLLGFGMLGLAVYGKRRMNRES